MALVVKQDELANPVDVGFLGADAVVPVRMAFEPGPAVWVFRFEK